MLTRKVLPTALLLLMAAGLVGEVSAAQQASTKRVSVDSLGAQGIGDSEGPSISAHGRFVAFYSSAANLVGSDTNGARDVFVRDRQTGKTARVSVDSHGAQGNGDSEGPSISADGRFVAFYSFASNLVAGDTNGVINVFVRDRKTGKTTRVSVNSHGAQTKRDSIVRAISADGRFVAFDSTASNLVGGDTNGVDDVFVRDRKTGKTTRVSVNSHGAQGNGDSFIPSISADGRFVAFYSDAANLVAGDGNAAGDGFVRDRKAGRTKRVSVASHGTQGNDTSFPPSISADGRFVAFTSLANNLVAGDTNGASDIFARGPLRP